MSDRSVRRSPGVLARESAGEVVIAVPGRDDFEVLSGTGSVIWLLLEEPRTVADLVRELAEVYAQPESSISEDVERFVSSLEDRGMIQEVTEP